MKTVRSSEYGIADAGALPEFVYVVDVTEPERYVSVHTTEPGAQQRIRELASDWGVPSDQVVSEVIEKVLEIP